MDQCYTNVNVKSKIFIFLMAALKLQESTEYYKKYGNLLLLYIETKANSHFGLEKKYLQSYSIF